MSPEIIDALPYDYKTDIWSMGCVLYFLCTLRPPFEAERIMELYGKIKSE